MSSNKEEHGHEHGHKHEHGCCGEEKEGHKHEHKHEHGEEKQGGHKHEHKHDHSTEDKETSGGHNHEHKHDEHKHDHKHDEHKEGFGSHDHSHSHNHGEDCDVCEAEKVNLTTADDVKDVEVPEWKKKALANKDKGNDGAAPFGMLSWNTEASTSATDAAKKSVKTDDTSEVAKKAKVEQDHNHS